MPLLLVRAFPSCEEELSPLLDALRELSEEDPLLGLEWNREKREIYLRITGKIQLEILSERLAGRYRLHANFSAPSVIYKETPAAPGEGSERYTMPKPCWACLTLRMDPFPEGAASSIARSSRKKSCLTGISIMWKPASGKPSRRGFTAGRSPMRPSP